MWIKCYVDHKLAHSLFTTLLFDVNRIFLFFYFRDKVVTTELCTYVVARSPFGLPCIPNLTRTPVSDRERMYLYINVTGVDAFVWLNEPNHCINTVECIPAECTQRTFSIDSEITQEIHQSHFPLLWLKREIIKYTQKLSFLGIFQNRKNKKPYVFYNRNISRSIFSTYSDKYIVS